MMGRLCLLVLAAGLLVLGPTGDGAVVHAQGKARIAVISFKNPTGWWGRELGASAASQLTTRLVNSGAFAVMERDRVKDIFDEWYLGQSGAVDGASAAKMGKLNGVEYLVTGEFKSFNITHRGASGIPIPGVRSIRAGDTRARSSINVRVFSVTTGEIIAAAEAEGEKRLGVSGGVAGFNYSELSTSSPWNPTIAEEALGEAMDKITATIVNQRTRFVTTNVAAPVAPAAPAGPGIAGFAADGSVYIDQGQNAGMTVGRRFHVLRVVDIIKDAKGNELDKVTKRVGIIEVTQVLPRSSICKIIEGKPDPKDLLEPLTK
jgi:curli biogenesis system outer membrane secretion channel CsgG